MIVKIYAIVLVFSVCSADNLKKTPNLLRSTKTLVPQLDGRIVGGTPANIADHPHQVTLHNWHRHSCGGSLIAPNWVLTAAHCTQGGLAGYSIRLGTQLWNFGGELHSVAKIIDHPNYNSSNYNYDVALLKLAWSQREVGDTIRYAKLPPDGWKPSVGSLAVVTGWGAPYVNGPVMPRLQEVQVPVISRETCQDYYAEYSNSYDIYIQPSMICAGFVDGGFDACQGDSGGPFIVDGYLTGVVSWGNGCGWPGYPGVYASVPHVLSWIKEQTGL